MIQNATPTLDRDGQRDFNAYLVRPSQGRGTGVVLIHDMFGLNGSIRDIAGEFAAQGYPVLVPNMFWRSKLPQALPYDDNQHPIAWERLNTLDLEAAAADIGTAARWLRGQPFCNGTVAAVGFCGGGRIAFLAAARTDIDAAVALYGLHISRHLGELGNIKCPVQIHYGLRDQHIPREEIDAVAKGVASHAGIDVVLYQAGHSFFNHVRPTFDPGAKALAADRIGRLLASLA